MAYTAYTPDPTTSVEETDDIDLPDDAELESAGIGAFNAPLEDLADRVAKAGARATFDVNWSETAGSLGVMMDELEDTDVARFLRSSVGGADIEISVGSNDGDLFIVTAAFAVETALSVTTEVYLGAYETGVGGYEGAFGSAVLVPAGTWTQVTLHGVFAATVDGSVTFAVEWRNVQSTGAAQAYGLFAMTVTRWRNP